jgi:hypothetical protein
MMRLYSVQVVTRMRRNIYFFSADVQRATSSGVRLP